MCLEFLKALSRCAPPLTVSATPEIDQLYVLRAAGLVQALFLKRACPPSPMEEGRFLVITPKGRQVLRAGVLPEEETSHAH